MSEQQVFDEACHAMERALIAIDASLSTLVLAREALVDRMQDLNRAHHGGREIPQADPLATMGQTPAGDCQHESSSEAETMGGIVRFCDACGEQA